MNIINTISRFLRSPDSLTVKDESSAGKKGEIIACMELKKKGYKIMEKNFNTKYGEIDIIAKQGQTICFIEVKARSSNYHGNPEEFVTKRKQKKLLRAAYIFISGNLLENHDYRFDVVSVDLVSCSTTIFTNAFEPDS